MYQTFPWSKLSSKAPTYWLVKILVGSSRDGALTSIRNHRPVLLESLLRCVLCFLRAPSISSSLVDWHTGCKVGSFIHSFSYRFLKTHGRVAPCVVTRKVSGAAVHTVENQETEQSQNQQGGHNFKALPLVTYFLCFSFTFLFFLRQVSSV